jgi:hypothetical protein
MGFSQAILSQSAVRVAFGTITGTYATALTTTGNVVLLNIVSNLDQEVVLSLNGGLNDHLHFPPGLVPTRIVLDLGSNELSYSGVIQIKHLGAAPTAGAISILAIRRA